MVSMLRSSESELCEDLSEDSLSEVWALGLEECEEPLTPVVGLELELEVEVEVEVCDVPLTTCEDLCEEISGLPPFVCASCFGFVEAAAEAEGLLALLLTSGIFLFLSSLSTS